MTLRPPRHRTRAVAAALTLLSLVACTGTFEPGLPLALLVVHGTGTEASQVLGFAADPPGPAAPRTVRSLATGNLAPGLAGPVVALDWLDRSETGAFGPGGRSRLVLLVSQRAAAPAQRSAALHGFDTAGFDVEAPAPFDPVPVLTFPLVAAGELQVSVRPGVLAPSGGVCLNGLSVSRDGRFVALLDQRTACDSGALASDNVLLLVDTVGAQPEVVWSTTASPVRAAPPRIDQAAARLDYVTGTVVRGLALATLTATPDSTALSGATTLDPIQAFGRHGVDRLVVTTNRLFRVEASGAVAPPAGVPTRPTTVGLIETGAGLPILLRASDALVVHANAADADPATLARPYLDGATDVIDQLAYLLRPGAIDTFDLLIYDRAVGDPIGSVLTSYPAPELTAPRLITWFRPQPATP
jgi:hypothetical protein